MTSRTLCGRMLVVSGALAFLTATSIGLGGAAAKAVVIQRTTIYVSALPKGCVKTTYSGGVVVWKCGALFYQPYHGRYVRVYIR
jgi:hypothetical protein